MVIQRNEPGRRKGSPKTGGRSKGTRNKATVAVQAMMRDLADDPQAFARYRALYRAGKLHPMLVRTIWAYAWGQPTQPVDLGGAIELSWRSSQGHDDSENY